MNSHLLYDTQYPPSIFRRRPLAVLFMAGSLAPLFAQAQSGIIEEILVMGAVATSAVTTDLKQVYDLPLSQSVISGEVLDRELGLDYEAISKRLANVSFNQENT